MEDLSRREQVLKMLLSATSSFRSYGSLKIFFILLTKNLSCDGMCACSCVWCYVMWRSQRTTSSVGPHHPPCFGKGSLHCSLLCAPDWLVLNLQGLSSIYIPPCSRNPGGRDAHTWPCVGSGNPNSGPTRTQQALSQSHLPSCPLPLVSIVNNSQ